MTSAASLGGSSLTLGTPEEANDCTSTCSACDKRGPAREPAAWYAENLFGMVAERTGVTGALAALGAEGEGDLGGCPGGVCRVRGFDTSN